MPVVYKKLSSDEYVSSGGRFTIKRAVAQERYYRRGKPAYRRAVFWDVYDGEKLIASEEKLTNAKAHISVLCTHESQKYNDEIMRRM